MEYFLSVAVMIAIFVVLASSYNLVIGYGGLATVAHPIFFALGAYTAGLLAIHTGLPAVLCVIAGAVVATLASVLLAASSLRVSGDYLLIVPEVFLPAAQTARYRIISTTVLRWIRIRAARFALPADATCSWGQAPKWANSPGERRE